MRILEAKRARRLEAAADRLATNQVSEDPRRRVFPPTAGRRHTAILS